MAKRIIELDNTNNPSPNMFMAVDQNQPDGCGTYRTAIHNVIGTVIGNDALPCHGGDSLVIRANSAGATYDMCMHSTVNVPAANSSEGGQVNMWYDDCETAAAIDAFVDMAAAYKDQSGANIGINKKWFRVLLPDVNGSQYAAMLIQADTGGLWQPVDTSQPMTLKPIGGNVINNIVEQSDTTALAHVSNTPPSVVKKGSLWFDTETAKLYVYDGLNWVQTNGGGSSGTGQT